IEACIAQAASIQTLSGERIREELFRIIAQPAGPTLVTLMAGTGILAHAIPVELSAETLAAGHGHPAFDLSDPLLGLTVALPPEMAPRDHFADHLRLSNADRQRLLAALKQMPENRQLAIHRHGAKAVADRAWIDFTTGRMGAASLEMALTEIDAFTPIPLPVNGEDLRAMGLAPGPAMGDILRAVEAWWFDNDRQADRDAVLAAAKQHIAEIDPRAD
ncbi:MAG: hypothetical protein AAF556_10665, partial [Pseudomonadota bacterium]